MTKGNLVTLKAHFIEPKFAWGTYCTITVTNHHYTFTLLKKEPLFWWYAFTRWQFTFLVFKIRSHDGILNTCNLQILGSCSTLKSPFNLQQKQQNTCLFSLFACQKRDFCTTEETRMSTIKKQSRLAKSLLHSVILKDNSLSYPPPFI